MVKHVITPWLNTHLDKDAKSGWCGCDISSYRWLPNADSREPRTRSAISPWRFGRVLVNLDGPLLVSGSRIPGSNPESAHERHGGHTLTWLRSSSHPATDFPRCSDIQKHAHFRRAFHCDHLRASSRQRSSAIPLAGLLVMESLFALFEQTPPPARPACRSRPSARGCLHKNH